MLQVTRPNRLLHPMAKPKQSNGKADPHPGFQISDEPILNAGEIPPDHEAKFASSVPTGGQQGEEGELPRTYGESVVFLLAQDPHRLFTYWDLDVRQHPGGPAVIRCWRSKGGREELEIEFEVPFETRNWYIPVGQAGTTYRVEIGFYRQETWHLLGSSAPATTPTTALSEDVSFTVRTLPLHPALQALLAKLPDDWKSRPDLLQRLAALKLPAPGLPVTAAENARALLLLQQILGGDLLFSLLSSPLSSETLSSRLAVRFEELASSGQASELLSSFQAAASASSLFSGLFSGVFAGLSESLSSAGLSSLESTSALSSASFAFSSEFLSSWSESLLSWSAAARTAAASEWLASWGLPGAATSSFASAEALSSLSSWQAAAGLSSSSLSSETLAAWTSSWESALSSWSSTALSSALTSWMQESLTSFRGVESGSWFQAPTGERKFFLHVNAEVIFYGGTHPEASVTIAGQPVQLSPDGTFHYHFIFPNEAYEIPIQAVSPDGVETRKAVLHFSRATEKLGDVADTGQPPLSAPMGRI